MLIDWLSLNISTSLFKDEQALRDYQSNQDRLLRVAGDGSVVWETCAWDSVRSDSHQLALQVTGTHVRIQGSPARVIGDGDNVFSAGASAALDLVGCFNIMINFISSHTGIQLPNDYKLWTVTRVDVTENLFLGDLPKVRQALSILRDCEGGRYRVSQQAGDTVYWSHKSRLRSGKAYAKGAELIHKMRQLEKSIIKKSISELNDKTNNVKQKIQIVREYTAKEILISSGLLRLELKLASEFFRNLIEFKNLKWYNLDSSFLENQWKDYFGRMIGGAEILNDQDIYSRLLLVVDKDKEGNVKENQAKMAFSLWCLIKSEGWEKARNITPKSTWFKYIKFLKLAGLSDADISAGNVVQLRAKILEAVVVRNWDELNRVHYLQAVGV